MPLWIRSGPFAILAAAAFLAAGATAAVAQTDRAPGKPLFEAGIIGGVGWLPDYPGADQNHLNGLALPWITYRGKYLRSDDKGLIRGRFIHTRDVEFDVSLNGSFKVDSRDNHARAGMPNLDWLGEVGPRLEVTLARAARWAKVDVELPVRAAFSTDLKSVAYRGLVTSPQIAYQNSNLAGSPLGMKLSAGPIFATSRLMDYFYGVAPQYATPDRPAYQAQGGYVGSRLQLVFSEPLFDHRVRMVYAGRVDYLGGASNASSPLFKDRMNYSVGVGLIISLYQSPTRVAN